MLGHAGGDHIEGRRLPPAAAAWLEHLEESESRLLMGEGMLGSRGGGIQGKRDLATDPGKQRLQIVDRLGFAFAIRQRRVGKAQHCGHLGLIGRKQHVRVFVGDQMNAVAHVEQAFDGIVVPAVRTVGQPRGGKRRDQHRIAQTTTGLLDIGLVDVGHTAEFVESGRGGTEQFRQTLAGGLAPSFENGGGRGFDEPRISRNRHHVKPSHGRRQIMVSDGLALGAGADGLVEVKP